MALRIGNIEISRVAVGSTAATALAVGGTVVWQAQPPAPVADWLCFTAEQANSTVHLDKVGSPDAISLETSTDGSTWTDYSWTDSTGGTLTLANVGDKVYMRAKTENQTIGSSNSNYYKFVMTGLIAASGNIQSLLKADCSRTDAPAYCYYGMFNGCTSLTSAPALPATALAVYCYYGMFASCSSLTAVPAELPAMTLAKYCYAHMFNSCTSLTTTPALPATTLADYCYSNMFIYCSSLTAVPAELPATTLTTQCYASMFNGCSSLTSAPVLPATTLATYCYWAMFGGCRSLSSVEVAFTAWSPTNATSLWITSAAASGTFTCPTALGTDATIERGTDKCPTGWTVVNV